MVKHINGYLQADTLVSKTSVTIQKKTRFLPLTGPVHGLTTNKWAQVWIQLQGVIYTIIISGVVAFIAFKIVDLTIGLRVAEDEEREGLDIASHGETAYNT